MYKFGDEVDGLKDVYDFGGAGHNDEAPPNRTDSPESPSRLEDIKVHSDEGEEDQTADNQVDFGGRESILETAPHPSVFGPDYQPNLGNGASSNFSSSDDAANKDKRKGDHKKFVAKEVLGLNKKSTSGMTPEEKKQALLEERWMKAMREERRLNELEAQVSYRIERTTEANLIPNFPPRFLCIKPIVHHDLAVVPEVRRGFVRLAYMNWFATCILLIVNMCVAIGVVFAPYREGAEKKFKPAQNTALAIVYLIGIPLGFIMWYWQVYGACSTGRHTKHLLSLCGLIVAFAFSVFMFAGPIDCGACGIALASDISKTKPKGVVVPVVVVLVLWAAEAGFLCYCIVRQWKYYRLDVNAQQEARRHMQNIIGV
ncbi:secretory carrier membrane protein 3 [Trypanosoma grayi]|uniref:secretory carrier membrane protein 3 n=1 Tax=Trypanosoma grayi TaxID=71804 RepID=UPI0004F44B6B|nr:secretory carrier membrane protein 3 [Trypanosoma grayi]KEG14202.1 secretory carrier membrane protein 3 [Trypanosoma grayi]